MANATWSAPKLADHEKPGVFYLGRPYDKGLVPDEVEHRRPTRCPCVGAYWRDAQGTLTPAWA
jgi:hypothetical protein